MIGIYRLVGRHFENGSHIGFLVNPVICNNINVIVDVTFSYHV